MVQEWSRRWETQPSVFIFFDADRQENETVSSASVQLVRLGRARDVGMP